MDVEKVEEILGNMKELQLKPTLGTYSILLRMYGKMDDEEKVVVFFFFFFFFFFLLFLCIIFSCFLIIFSSWNCDY